MIQREESLEEKREALPSSFCRTLLDDGVGTDTKSARAVGNATHHIQRGEW